MTKIEMARCYPHMDNSSILNGIITDVESHYNNMVEVISKLEGRITKVESCLTDSVKNLDWVIKEKRLDDDSGKELHEQIAHHRRVEEFYKQIAELKEENKKLREENSSLKEDIEKLVSVVHNLNKIYGGAK